MRLAWWATTANAIAPNKRSLSSMAPSFVETPKGLMIIGTPGGSYIISMVLLGTLDYHGRHEVRHEIVDRSDAITINTCPTWSNTRKGR